MAVCVCVTVFLYIYTALEISLGYVTRLYVATSLKLGTRSTPDQTGCVYKLTVLVYVY